MNNKQFNLNDHSWFIRVNTEDDFNATLEWAKVNGFIKYPNSNDYKNSIKGLAQDVNFAKGFIHPISEYTISNPRFKEVFVEFEKALKVKTVTIPVGESEQERKIRELREEINNMQKKLEELEKSVE